MRFILVFLLCSGLLCSCSVPPGLVAVPGNAAPVAKIALIASFEGLERPVGYAALREAKAAIAEANAQGRFGAYRVALVALNDDLDPETAAAQARAAAMDDDVLAVLGPFGSEAGDAAAPVLASAGVPSLMLGSLTDRWPGIWSVCPLRQELEDQYICFIRIGMALHNTKTTTTQKQTPSYTTCPPNTAALAPDAFRPWLIAQMESAAEEITVAACAPDGLRDGEYRAGEGDASLEHAAALAKWATERLLEAIADDVAAHGRPTRAGTAHSLGTKLTPPGLTWYRVEGGRWMPLQP